MLNSSQTCRRNQFPKCGVLDDRGHKKFGPKVKRPDKEKIGVIDLLGLRNASPLNVTDRTIKQAYFGFEVVPRRRFSLKVHNHLTIKSFELALMADRTTGSSNSFIQPTL